LTRYAIEFAPRARKAWDRLDAAVKRQLAKKLVERQEQPRVASARVRSIRDGYKIKARKAGVRLIYTIIEQRVVILVLAVGMRAGSEAYKMAEQEFAKLNQRS
jgi:mRNA interferase RelE/StbE